MKVDAGWMEKGYKGIAESRGREIRYSPTSCCFCGCAVTLRVPWVSGAILTVVTYYLTHTRVMYWAIYANAAL